MQIAVREKKQLMSASEIDRTLVRLAHEILEKTEDLDRLAFIGIRRRGVPLAQRLAAKIEQLENRRIPVGILDINLYRDDLSTVADRPVLNARQIGFSTMKCLPRSAAAIASAAWVSCSVQIETKSHPVSSSMRQ